MSCPHVMQGTAEGRATKEGPIMLSALTATMVRAGLIRPSPDESQPRVRSRSRSQSTAMHLPGESLAGPQPSATPPPHCNGPSRPQRINSQADALSVPFEDSLAGHRASTTPPTQSDYPLKPQPSMMHTPTPSHHGMTGDQPSAVPSEHPSTPFDFTPSTRHRRPRPLNPVSSLTPALSCWASELAPPLFRQVAHDKAFLVQVVMILQQGQSCYEQKLVDWLMLLSVRFIHYAACEL